jgi:hypothetical protein
VFENDTVTLLPISEGIQTQDSKERLDQLVIAIHQSSRKDYPMASVINGVERHMST